MDTSMVPEKEFSVWTLQNDNIVIEFEANKYILNQSSRVVWELIDGVSAVDEIIQQVVDQYGENYTRDYITDIVINALEMLHNEHMIKFYHKNDFDGWLKYE